MEFLDCRGCCQPLSPPVFQCSLGHPHFLCASCRGKLPESKCKTCSGDDFGRCPTMEDAVNKILLPCKHGCGENITYYRKEGHEKVCKAGPCFCPEPCCGFGGQNTALFDHFTTHHKWPAKDFVYKLGGSLVPGMPLSSLNVPAVPCIHVLRGDDGHLFLLKVAPLESRALTASLVSVQPNSEEPIFQCSFSYKWHSYLSQNVWFDKITNSSLSNGLPEGCFCILPSVAGGGDPPLLTGVCIAPTKIVDDENEMEWDDDEDGDDGDDDDDDCSFDEYEDD